MRIVIIAVFICAVFILATDKVRAADTEQYNQKPELESQEESQDIISTFKNEADDIEGKFDKVSSQFEKILDIIIEKYNELMPKIREAGERLQEKIEELLKKLKKDEQTIQDNGQQLI